MKYKFILKFFVVISCLIIELSAYAYRPYVPKAARLELEKKNVESIIKAQLAKKGLNFGQLIFIRVFKEDRELEVWVKGDAEYKLFKTYTICNFSGTLGPKLKRGDGQAPEGFYHVGTSQMLPNSNYHLSFNINYPNAYDRSYEHIGNYPMIHGGCVSNSSYAMTDKSIEEIYLLAEASLKYKQPTFSVHIFPFKMTSKNMEKHKASKWSVFWQNLKEGYDYFETNKVLPTIKFNGKKYKIIHKF